MSWLHLFFEKKKNSYSVYTLLYFTLLYIMLDFELAFIFWISYLFLFQLFYVIYIYI